MSFFGKITGNVPALGEVANFGTDYFLSKIKFLARNKREFTTKFAILPNACYAFGFYSNFIYSYSFGKSLKSKFSSKYFSSNL